MAKFSVWEFIGITILVLLFVALLFIVSGWALSVAWNVFLVPVLGATAITPVQGTAGLVVVWLISWFVAKSK